MKKGDIVRCVDNYVTDRKITMRTLTIGNEYEVIAVNNEFITVLNDVDSIGDYFSNRFEVVNKENEEDVNMSKEFVVGGKAECIANNGVSDCISLYKVYEVLEVLANAILIKDDYNTQAYYRKDRFNPIKTANELTVDDMANAKSKPVEPRHVIETDNLKVSENGATTITTNGLTITDNEGKVVSGITSTSEPYKVENGEIKPMLSMTKEDVDNVINIIDANSQIIQLPKDVNILGTTYTVDVISVEEDSYLDGIYGYCDFMTKSIVLRELKPLDYQGNIDAINAQYKTNLRHELMHAFLYESGLDSSTLDNWARNEEMIDFMAIQLPKIFKVFNECGITE